MSRNLYIADMHLGHQNSIGFDGRPFSNIDEHDKALITNWNAVVMPDDHVLRGNHDKRSAEYESCFESVDDILKIGDMMHGSPVEVIMCHYWIPFLPELRRGAYMLHGHTHKGGKEQHLEEQLKAKIRQNYKLHRAYNVGCMWQDYYPQTLEQIVARQKGYR